jgi:FlaA1/EpsC-like NDP-sugar epimerase
MRQLLSKRVWFQALVYVAVFAWSYWVAFVLRFDLPVPEDKVLAFQNSLFWVLGVKLAIYFLWGHITGWWRHVTFADLTALLRASVGSLLALLVLDQYVWNPHVDKMLLVIDWIVSILCVGFVRASWRMFRDHVMTVIKPQSRRGALLVGSDDAVGILAHQIQSNPQWSYRIAGFLDPDHSHKGMAMGGIPVLGSPENVVDIAKANRVTDVLITTGTLPGSQLRRLMANCDEGGLNLKILPSVTDLLSGDRRIPIRNIEISDLLRRDPIQLDTKAIEELLEGRTVMITGAGGSIGSEICRQIIKFKPKTMVLVEKGEHGLFMIDRELRAADPSIGLELCVSDITDRSRMHKIFDQHTPEVVFHAAAHKHVPLMEANIGEAIRNNVLGTKNLADLADEFGVLSFVMISTDKAVKPTSVMGVSKQLAERYVHAISQESSTRFMVVRFGNVLGSSGSVVPIFQEQIRRGGPITITDARMTRFFMTIPEASQLVLQAGAGGRGGEIFVLEMGKPVKIVDLALDLIRLSGLPRDAIEINFTGLRPGEKLYEELYFEDEQTLQTAHPKVRAAFHRPFPLEEVRRVVAELLEMIYEPDPSIREKLHEVVVEYKEFIEGKSEAKVPQAS